MLQKIRVLFCLVLLGTALALAGCSSSSVKPVMEGVAESVPPPDESAAIEVERPDPASVLENATALSGYRSQSGSLEKPFVRFPNKLFLYETDCYRLELNTPFTGITEIDRQLDDWSEGLRDRTADELNESCFSGVRDLFLQVNYETSVTRGQTIGMVFFMAKYTGGAHPIPDIETMNFNAVSGEILLYQDIFAQTDGLYEFLSDYAYRALRPSLSEYWNQDGGFSEGLAPKAENFKNFVITPDGLVLIFPQYQIAPYSAGIQTSLVPLDSLVKFQPRPGVWQ